MKVKFLSFFLRVLGFAQAFLISVVPFPVYAQIILPEHLIHLERYAAVPYNYFNNGDINPGLYYNLNAQVQTNINFGYLGQKEGKKGNPQIIIDEVSKLINLLDTLSIDDLNKLSKGEIEKVNAWLVGASIGLRAVRLHTFNLPLVEWLQRRLYSKNCLLFSSYSNVRSRDPIILIWISECFVATGKSYSYASLLFNVLPRLTQESPNLKNRVYAYGLGIGYEALLNGTPDSNDLSFGLLPIVDKKIEVAYRTMAYAEKTDEPESKYIAYEISRRVFYEKGLWHEVEQIDDKIVDIAISSANLSVFKKFFLLVNRHKTLILFGIITFLILLLGQSLYVKDHGLVDKRWIWNLILVVIGVTEARGISGLYRSLILLLLGLALNEVLSAAATDIHNLRFHREI